jgi:hypothetical protein
VLVTRVADPVPRSFSRAEPFDEIDLSLNDLWAD